MTVPAQNLIQAGERGRSLFVQGVRRRHYCVHVQNYGVRTQNSVESARSLSQAVLAVSHQMSTTRMWKCRCRIVATPAVRFAESLMTTAHALTTSRGRMMGGSIRTDATGTVPFAGGVESCRLTVLALTPNRQSGEMIIVSTVPLIAHSARGLRIGAFAVRSVVHLTVNVTVVGNVVATVCAGFLLGCASVGRI